MEATTRFWRSWVNEARSGSPVPRADPALDPDVKGLTYMPTGATVAAPTTSLPETPGGERNWDYRYAWMRDATFTLQALHWLNLDWEAEEFMQFVADLEPNADGSMQIMYGIDGRRDLTSPRATTSRGTPARARADRQRPFDQRQTTSTARRWTASCCTPVQPAAVRGAYGRSSRARPSARCASARAGPGHLGGARRAAALRLVEAHVLGRHGSRGQARRDPRRPRTPGAAGARSRKDPRDILTHGVNARGVLRQHYDTDALDASNLLAAVFGFLPATTRGCGRACWRSPTS